MKVRFAILEEDPEQFFLCRANHPEGWDLGYIAEECAEEYYDHMDGWESSWPLTFILRDEADTKELGRFKVDLESVASFSATPN